MNIWTRAITCALAATVTWGTTTAAHAADDPIAGKLDRMVSRTYSQYAKDHSVPAAAGVLVHTVTPSGSWTAKTGLPKGAGAGSHYRVASVSKTMTAAAIMLLHQRGKLRIGDTVDDRMPGRKSRYLPNVADYALPYRDRITIRHLLSHRAGVYDLFNDAVPEDAPVPYAGRYYWDYRYSLTGTDAQLGVDELARALSESGASYGPPDAQYHYSDTGYNLLAKIVERVSGRPFARFVTQEFVQPMGLRDTRVVTDAYDTGLPTPFLRGWSKFSDAGWARTVKDNMSSQVGPGSVISTSADMARWMSGLLSGKGPLRPGTVRKMTRIPDGNTTYALGISRTDYGLGHSGAHPGYINIVEYDAKDDVVVVVVTPFIDYTTDLNDHLALLLDLVGGTREITGFPVTDTQK